MFMGKHKKLHRGTMPGLSGTPFTSAVLERWIVDLLHVDLNHGKLSIGLPLDLRTKEEGRQPLTNSTTVAIGISLCAAAGSCRGGAVNVARLVAIVATYYGDLEAAEAAKVSVRKAAAVVAAAAT
eukprot:6154978-Pleurochrysis_carterae.AAC.1